MESQFWNTGRMADYQLRKIKRLVNHAYENVPYYSRLFRKERIHPDDINTFHDFQQLPVLTKEIARRENHNLISQPLENSKVKRTKTGGTTGPPLAVVSDAASRSFVWGSYYRWYRWMNINERDPVAIVWGTNRVLSKKHLSDFKHFLIDFIQNNLTFNAFNINPLEIRSIVNKLNSFRPKLIRGYLSALLQIAESIQEQHLSLSFTPMAVSTTTETLLPNHRKYLVDTFKSAVFDQYGCGEVEGIAYECACHEGLHVTNEHVFLEILDDNHNQVLDGQGRIVVTDLDNFAMPFIRYENGDLSSLSLEKCRCGVAHPKLMGVDGRMSDTIILKNGNSVHGVFFTDIFHEVGITSAVMNRFQVYQRIPGKIELRLEKTRSIEKSKHELLRKALERFFSHVEVTYHEKIPSEKNGKFRYIISDMIDSN